MGPVRPGTRVAPRESLCHGGIVAGAAASRLASSALVLVSGGIDSAVALFWAKRQGWVVHALTFDYPTRPPRESDAVRALARAADVEELHAASLPWMAEAADLPSHLKRNRALDRAPEGYVPVRNLAFYAIAAYYAEALGARHVVGGHNRTDVETFPDASPGFFRLVDEAIARGALTFRESPFRVELPLAKLTKQEVLALGFDLGVPYEATWSCYWNDRAEPCGGCASCVERKDAFDALGRTDPLVVA